MNPPPRVLIAGIGNIFLGDDAFGVEVAQRLLRRPWPEEVRVVDFGIRGFDLAYAILDGPALTILVDATPRGGAPGTLYVIEPDLDTATGQAGPGIDSHSMDPVKVLQLVHMFGGRPEQMLVVGCEPATFGPEGEGQMGFSAPVAAALDGAVRLVETLAGEFIASGRVAGVADA